MSTYVFRGNLQALICSECRDSVGGAQILLYRHLDHQDVDELVVARSKHTYDVLSVDAAKEKASRLIAEATTDADGSFSFELGKGQGYDGGEFELDVRLTTVKGADSEKKHEAVQFTITSLRPDWKEDGNLMVAAPWQHTITSRYWCYLLARFDVWVICGRVVSIDSQTPLQGMTVRAFDRDWIQDDLLGQDVTNNSGVFHIYYTSGTFKKTPFSPFLNIEMTSGPDVYFEVEDSGGNLLLDESPAEGRNLGRENVGHCYCTTLEVGEQAPPYESPWFTHVGNFHILWDIDSTTGRTRWSKNGAGGTDWGFHSHTKLEGYCPKVKMGTNDPMYYRFLFMDPVTSTETAVTGEYLRKVKVGSKLVWWDPDNDSVFGWTTQSIHVAGSGATVPVSGGTGPVPDHIIVPDGNGWIAVDQDALDNGFYGSLIRLRTEKIVSGGGAPGSGAGIGPADPRNGAMVTLIFETTTDPTNPALTVRQMFTVTLLINNWAEVRELDLQEFQSGFSGSCTGLTTGLTILYTIDHEIIDEWKVSMASAASGWSQPPGLPQGSAPRGGFGSHPTLDITAWPACSYTVRLSSRRALTDGENNDDWDTLPVTFCKT